MPKPTLSPTGTVSVAGTLEDAVDNGNIRGVWADKPEAR